MALRKLVSGLALGALVLVGGCRSTSSYRQVYASPVAVAAPAPCCNGVPAVAATVAVPAPVGAQVPPPPCAR